MQTSRQQSCVCVTSVGKVVVFSGPQRGAISRLMRMDALIVERMAVARVVVASILAALEIRRWQISKRPCIPPVFEVQPVVLSILLDTKLS